MNRKYKWKNRYTTQHPTCRRIIDPINYHKFIDISFNISSPAFGSLFPTLIFIRYKFDHISKISRGVVFCLEAIFSLVRAQFWFSTYRWNTITGSSCNRVSLRSVYVPSSCATHPWVIPKDGHNRSEWDARAASPTERKSWIERRTNRNQPTAPRSPSVWRWWWRRRDGRTTQIKIVIRIAKSRACVRARSCLGHSQKAIFDPHRSIGPRKNNPGCETAPRRYWLNKFHPRSGENMWMKMIDFSHHYVMMRVRLPFDWMGCYQFVLMLRPIIRLFSEMVSRVYFTVTVVINEVDILCL